MSKAFDKIAAGLADAIAFAEGGSEADPKGHPANGRVAAGQPAPAKAGAKAIRGKTKLSQAKFAEKLHIPVATVRPGHPEPAEGLGTAPPFPRRAGTDAARHRRRRSQGGDEAD